MRASAYGLAPDDLRALGWARDAGELFARLHRGRPALGREAQAFVDAKLDVALPRIASEAPSRDGSTRVVLELADGARIEAVHMPRAVKRPRVTLCVSSQVGCAMGCAFCATATMGLVRSLAPHEIVAQVIALVRRLGPRSAEGLSLVFMGMGEPLHDADALVRALDLLCDPRGLGIAPARVTVSTAGHVSGLARLARARHLPQLAVSVTAATGDVRRRLMPIDRKWPLAELRAALARWPLAPHRKITLEVVLLAGVNDDDASADRLADFASGLRHVVDLIPFNAWRGSAYREPAPERVRAFAQRLHERGCLVKVRATRGRDVRAACGTLVAAGPAREY